MQTLEGTITSMKKNRTGFQMDDGNWYGLPRGKTTEMPEYNCQRGDTVKIGYTQNGQWNNIQEGKFRVLSSDGPAPTAAKAGTGQQGRTRGWHLYEDADFQKEMGSRIARSTALTQAVALCAGTDVNGEDDVIAVAAKFAAFILDEQAPAQAASEPAAAQSTQADDFDDDVAF